MNIKLEKKLFKKYPKLFRQKDLPMDQTAMCWGIQCGDGWYDLIDKVCEYLQSMIKWNDWPQIEFNTVKEKYGTLRIYWDIKIKTEKEFKKHKELKKKYKTFDIYVKSSHGLFEFVDGVISFAEHLSGYMCELCGQKGKQRKINDWIYTLCDKCSKKRQQEAS
ncbi:MAG: hypothetical protein ACTSVB_08050 [Candidatus Heimdallarchaeaceae archaeon]